MTAKPKTSIIFKICGPEDTLRLAGHLAGLLRGGEVVSLTGMIGAGKTFFVQGLARALGSRVRPVSASFNLMRTYPPACAGGGTGRCGLNIYHFDLFRVAASEMDNLGLEDYLGRPDGFTAIEWSEPARSLYRRCDFLELDFDLAGGDKRTVRASAGGAPAEKILRDLKKKWLKR